MTQAQLLTDPQINVLLGASYLHQLVERYEKEGLSFALAAYNVGPGKLRKLLRETGRPPLRYSTQVEETIATLRRAYFDDQSPGSRE